MTSPGGSHLSWLTVTAEAPGTDIDVYDADLRRVAAGRDDLRLELPEGLYRIDATAPSAGIHSEILDLVGGEETAFDVPLPARHLVLPRTLAGSDRARRHAAALDSMTRVGRSSSRAAGLIVMARVLGDDASARYRGWLRESTVDVLDPARRSLRRFRRQWAEDEEGDWAGASHRVRSGTYTLRIEAGEVATEQSVVCVDGWQSIVVIPITSRGLRGSMAAIMMRPIGEPWSAVPDEDVAILESVYAALRSGRQALTPERLRTVLSSRLRDPMLALLAARQCADESRPGQEDVSVQPLTRSLHAAMPEHPDVVAMSSDGAAASPYPPMMTATLSALQRNSSLRGRDPLPPGSYAEHAAAAAVEDGIWLTWRPETGPTRGGHPQSDFQVPFVGRSVERLVDSDSGRPFLGVMLAWLVFALGTIRPLRPWLGRVASRLAGRATSALMRRGAARVLALGNLVGQIKGATPAFGLLRSDPVQVAYAARVPLRVATTIHDGLTKRLGSAMTDTATAQGSSAAATSAAQENNAEPSGTASGSTPLVSGTLVFAAAIAILIAFGVLVVWMLGRTHTDEVSWNRQVYIYGSVEAIVFAAAGALFGVQVKRSETTRAQQQADQATQEAQEAKTSERLAAQDAEKGRTIAAAARGLAAASTAAGETSDVPGGARGFGAGLPPHPALQAMANVANELFPPTS